MNRWSMVGVALALLFGLCACSYTQMDTVEPTRTVVLQETPYAQVKQAVCKTTYGGEAVFELTLRDGYEIAAVYYDGYTITSEGEKQYLTLENVRYNQTVTMTLAQQGIALRYHANGGLRLDGGAAEETVEEYASERHLRCNTSLGANLFYREGYVQIGWNTQPDGSGTYVGLGSRMAPAPELTLYAQWSAWTPAEEFDYAISDGMAVITGYHGTASCLTIPAELHGARVVAIGAQALRGAACSTVILPPSILRLEQGCFAESAIEELYLFDTVTTLSESCFADCEALRTLHLQAASVSVYGGSYFDTFQDKLDRLIALRGEKKLVLFSGSSTRFGFDSARMEAALPGYQVVNMGVFAYSDAAAQLAIIRAHMESGDVLLHAPEFDAAQQQFCSKRTLDASFFAMMESNYDAIATLDLRAYHQVFSALNTYLYQRSAMLPKGYAACAADYDENGVRTDTPSYNAYGDYILYRGNAAQDAPVYNFPADYTREGFVQAGYTASINEIYECFLAEGIEVYFTYAPRNALALSPHSDAAARAQLDAYLRAELIVPVISDIEASLYEGKFLYETDNHLSTQGVALRTTRVLADLAAQGFEVVT